MKESRLNTKPVDDDQFWEWLKVGIDKGFCMAGVCQTHEGVGLEEWEEAEFEEGYDPCVVVIRLLGPYAPPVEAPDYSAFRGQSS